MTDIQFCYWLMGIFEIVNVRTFSKHQFILIKEHLNLVQDKKSAFCFWLKGVLDLSNDDYFNEQKTLLILNKLKEEFKNNIDKSYDPIKNEILYKIHERK